jgi:hypothetical protein
MYKKCAIPALGILYCNIPTKTFWKNNKSDVSQGVTSDLKNIASTYYYYVKVTTIFYV